MTSPTAHVFNIPEMKAARRQLRNFGTPAEASLWNILKGKRVEGLRFRRQFSIGSYVLDFYCPAIKTAIELDGNYHYEERQMEDDRKRDVELLDLHGIKTLRFENKIVFEQPETIIGEILNVVRSTPPGPLLSKRGREDTHC